MSYNKYKKKFLYYLMSIDELYKNGYTVLPSLISGETCDRLAGYLNDKIANNPDLPYNYYKGHDQLRLPNNEADIPQEILLNTKIQDILREVFGRSYYLYSYTCNANTASQDQPIHMDCSHFHPIKTIRDFGSPGPPIQLIVNTYLQDTDETNGSLEMVKGSHLTTDFEMGEDGEIDDKYVGERERCNYPKGSVIIRDKRTWHRGTTNPSGKPRYMVGTSYSASWYKLSHLTFNPDAEEIFENAPFSVWNIKYE